MHGYDRVLLFTLRSSFSSRLSRLSLSLSLSLALCGGGRGNVNTSRVGVYGWVASMQLHASRSPVTCVCRSAAERALLAGVECVELRACDQSCCRYMYSLPHARVVRCSTPLSIKANPRATLARICSSGTARTPLVLCPRPSITTPCYTRAVVRSCSIYFTL